MHSGNKLGGHKVKFQFKVINDIHQIPKLESSELIEEWNEEEKIAIKKAANVSSLSNIVFPTNLKQTHKDLANAVKALQKYLKARLHILYVNVPANFSPDRVTEKHLLDFARQHEFKNCAIHIYNDIDEESGIINFSSKFKNKIVAMSTHGRKGINRLMSGSIAEDVVNHVDCPIWTLSER